VSPNMGGRMAFKSSAPKPKTRICPSPTILVTAEVQNSARIMRKSGSLTPSGPQLLFIHR
jgi:hypothetical protein